MHPGREKLRGYNQSRSLAEGLAQKLMLPYQETLLKNYDTPSQTKLDRKKRRDNLSRAFSPAPDQALKGKNFLIIDDVTTTGTTLKEAAKVLKRNGAGIVWGMALAYEPTK